jgi:23S rRNA pseudouridine1911/1915/1917 synthase
MTRIEVLYEDADLIAVNKPARLAVIPGRDEDDCLLYQLGRQIGLPATGDADPRLRVVHRLDKDTSGVIVFAKTLEAQRALSGQFQKQQTAKQYLALVVGRPTEPMGTVDAPLGAHPSSPLRRAVVRHGGRPAVTDWVIEQKFREYTLLRVFPKTGKTHQIRVHLKHAGFPLAIDPLYNEQRVGKPLKGEPKPGIYLSKFKRDYRPNRDQKEFPLIDRLTLHAEKLELKKPDGTPLQLTAVPPKDFRAVLNMLGRHSPA